MASLGYRSWLTIGAVLAIASGGALAWLASSAVIPSLVRDPMSDFVQPGVTIWWLTLGGPFRNGPDTAGGIAFAAVANALLWLVGLGLVLGVIAIVRRLGVKVR